MLLNIYGYRKDYFYLVISILTIFIAALSSSMFISEELFYNSFSDLISVDKIDEIMQISKRWVLLGYAFVPLTILLRSLYTATCLYSASFFGKSTLQFKDCFTISLKADAVFLLANIAILIYWSLVGVNTIEEYSVNPFSLLRIVDSANIERWLRYPLLQISLFELLYWLTLAKFLSIASVKPFGKSLAFVVGSYGVGLLLWIVVVMFLTINT